MKLLVVIFCLLVTITSSASKRMESSKEKCTLRRTLSYTQRWQLNLAAFEHGTKIENSQGQLVQLNLANATSKQEAVKGLAANVHFQIYTKWNPTEPMELSPDEEKIGQQLRQSYFDAAKPTIFVTHGWKNDGKSNVCTRIRDAYLSRYNVNVIVVDWSDIGVDNYEIAARQSIFIGDKIAEMIHALIPHAHMYLRDVTLVGHGMGAHIMGIAGHQINGLVDTIFGLDPARPLFAFSGTGHKLSRMDAEYVQVIHTNIDHLGFTTPLGHADFYVNGGKNQKGCKNSNPCSHSRAYEYFTESISNPDSFYGSKFTSYAALERTLSGSMSYVVGNDVDAKMGGHPADKTIRGVYYIETRNEAPFGLGKYS